MSWTQPICITCWERENPGRKPVQVRFEPPPIEQCCLCGDSTSHGIYVRKNPATVPYPAREA